MSRLAAGRPSSDGPGYTPEQLAQKRVDEYNSKAGDLNLADGYNCPKCMNRGYFAYAEAGGLGGYIYDRYRPCECQKVRASIARMKRSGLENTIRDKRLNNFQAETYWQKKMLEKATAYIDQGVKDGEWFYIGGQSGAGKTHICTGIVRELLYAGLEVRYIVWEQALKALKAVINDPEYGEQLGQLEEAEVLYIDDLFKPISDKPPTDADLRVAFELLNYRYVNNRPTIISSERYLGEIFDLDEATGGRIYEKSRGYTLIIDRAADRNYRRKEAVTV